MKIRADHYFFDQTCTYKELQTYVERCLDSKKMFDFCIHKLISFNQEEEEIIVHPDIFSTEPIFGGPTKILLNFLNDTEESESKHVLIEDPTWRDTLNIINNELVQANVHKVLLGFDLVGFTENGFGYIVHPVLV